MTMVDLVTVDVATLTPQAASALRLALDGFAVFPLKAGTKVPHPKLAPHGFKSATADLEMVRAWWAECPDANVGLPTGERVTVLDVDPRNGGGEVYDALLDRFGNFPNPSWQVETQSRGLHVYFRPDPRASKSGPLLPGIDIKDRGGYVVAPGSVGELGPYSWVCGGPGSGRQIAAQPEWLVRRRAPKSTPVSSPARSTSSGVARPQGFPEGYRDAGLFQLACAWRGRDIPVDHAMSAIVESAGLCSPPFPRDQALDRVQRAYSQFPAGRTR